MKKDQKKPDPLLSKQDLTQIHLCALKIKSEIGNWEELVTYAEEHKKSILNRLKMREYVLLALEKLERWEEARSNAETLLMYLPNNLPYLESLIRCREALGEQKVEILKNIYEKDKRSKLKRKLLLNELSAGEEFENLVTETILNAARKVHPSFPKEIYTLYENSEKKNFIGKKIEEIQNSLEKNLTFPNKDEPEFPTVIMYIYYLNAHHHLRIKNYTKGLELIGKAIEHTPTFVESHILKAKLLSKQLKYGEAAKVLCEAQQFDEADRYLTNATSKALLRNGKIAEGDKLFKSVMKLEEDGVEKTLHTLQKMWYEIEVGRAYIKQYRWGRGLRQFNFVLEHVKTIAYDQLDFCNFALRKYNIAEFVEMVRFNCERIQNNENISKGLCEYLKYGLRYQKLKPVLEKVDRLDKEKLGDEEWKKEKKELKQKNDKNSVVASKEEVADLKLEGKEIIENLDLKEIASLVNKIESENPKIVRRANLPLFDYYLQNGKKFFYKENLLLLLRSYKKLEKVAKKSDAQFLFRQVLFKDLGKKSF